MIPLTFAKTFPHPMTGEPMPELFVSEVSGSRLEWSMHDETIQATLPADFWTPVYANSAKTLRQETIQGWIVFLVGMGPDSDEAGRLLLIRHRLDSKLVESNDPQTIAHIEAAKMVIAQMLAPHHFDEHQSVWDSIAGN